MPTKDFLNDVKPGSKILKESLYTKGTYYVSANDLDTKPSYEALKNAIEQHSPSYILENPTSAKAEENPPETVPSLAGEELANKFIDTFKDELEAGGYNKNRFYKADLTSYIDELKKLVSAQDKRTVERFFTGPAS